MSTNIDNTVLANGNMSAAHLRSVKTPSVKYQAHSFLCMTSCTYLPALYPQFLCCFEDLLHSPGNHTSGFRKLVPLHCVRLSTSSLAICKAADIVAIQSRLHQQGDLLKDLQS